MVRRANPTASLWFWAGGVVGERTGAGFAEDSAGEGVDFLAGGGVVAADVEVDEGGGDFTIADSYVWAGGGLEDGFAFEGGGGFLKNGEVELAGDGEDGFADILRRGVE